MIPACAAGLILCAVTAATGLAQQDERDADRSRAGRPAAPAPSLGLRGTTREVAEAPAESAPSRARPVRPLPRTSGATRGLLRGPLKPREFAPEVRKSVASLGDPGPPPVVKRRKKLLDDPYAPLGLRLGGLTLYGAIEDSVGYDTNPNRTDTVRRGSLVNRTEGELKLQSDWSVHELAGALRGAYSLYPDVKGADRPEGAGELKLRLDASRDTQIDLETRFLLDTQRPGSPEFDVVPSDRPLVTTFGGSAGATQRFNRLALSLRGSVDRTVYEDAKLGDGTVLDQSDRDRTEVGLRLRAGYELNPGLIPFVEAQADTRVYDQTVDNGGFRRESVGASARLGTTFELTRLVTGEVSAGYQERRYEDARLPNLRGPIADVALIWAATPLTTVRLRAASKIGETTLLGSSGVLDQAATLEVQHDLRRNVSLTGALTLTSADYDGLRLREEGLIGTVKLDYKLTRSVALRASFTHERLKSTAEGSDYTANVYLLGLKFQP